MSNSGSISAVGHSYLDVASGTRLDAWFPAGASADAPPARSCLAVELGVNVGETVTVTIDDLAVPPADLTDAYLRLHLLSRREIRPHEANLDGLFGLLTNCAWTSAGPVLPDRVDALRTAAASVGQPVTVTAVDKIPRMVDYVIPSGVRIADADRVRLGAHLADGTTVMHEGFVNFNAGTLGPAMVEGRISAGVVVGAHSDLGGSASTMGTLSGGGKEIVSVGEHCLLGANSGIGIALGDYCTVEAGLYVTAGSRITLPDGSVVKGRDISGRSGMLLIRNSTTGAIEMRVADPSRWEGINPELHKN
ncbi:DapH/DapD/GlmU-related protein [Candidatus Poriferisodalis sp.]|uniref:DapH/DapD/GlmU-related protein n=1 Tax=Candidatus Poriferisodalis sp. TaxID=3101277 RepID=UPI003D104C2C